MSMILLVIVIAGILATLISLGLGVFNLITSKGEKKRALLSNKLMRWRIIFQVITLIIFTAFLIFTKKSHHGPTDTHIHQDGR